MATAVPDIGPLVSLVGSIGFSVLGLIVPVVMETVWYYYPKDNDDDDDDDRDDDLPGSRWGGTAAVNGSGGVTAVSATVESIAVPVTVATDKKKKPTKYCYTFRRIVRHIKNVVILLLAICALVGGAFYNIRDIINQALSDGSSVDPVI